MEEIPKEIGVNLEPGEKVRNLVETFSVKGTPEYLVVTDRRVIYVQKKILGRYELVAIPYMKMREVKARLGKMIWGEFMVAGEEGVTIDLRRVKRESIASTFESMKDAINETAVEPISILHRKGLLDEEWNLSKPPESVLRYKAPTATQTPQVDEDPLRILGVRLAKGEISKEEYEEMRKMLESPYQAKVTRTPIEEQQAQLVTVVYCTKCGGANALGHKFCSSCGAEIKST